MRFALIAALAMTMASSEANTLVGHLFQGISDLGKGIAGLAAGPPTFLAGGGGGAGSFSLSIKAQGGGSGGGHGHQSVFPAAQTQSPIYVEQRPVFVERTESRPIFVEVPRRPAYVEQPVQSTVQQHGSHVHGAGGAGTYVDAQQVANHGVNGYVEPTKAHSDAFIIRQSTEIDLRNRDVVHGLRRRRHILTAFKK